MADSHKISEPPDLDQLQDHMQAHHVYLGLTIAMLTASVVIVAAKPQSVLIRYIVDMLRAGWVATAVGYYVKRSEFRWSRRLERLERTEDDRYSDGYSDGYVDGVSQQSPQIDSRRLRSVASSKP